MRVLVTGGAGFIGSNFLNLLVPRHPEHDFLNVDALTYAANPLNLESLAKLPNYRFQHVDIRDADRVDATFASFQPDVVVHFAAESHVDRSIHGPRVFVKTNVEGTLNLLEACRRCWPKHEGLFQHVSTDEVFGSLGLEGAFTEDSPYDPSSPYAASKAASDHLVRAYARTYGMRIRISNCSNNYGPMQFPEKLIPLMILNLLDGKELPVYGKGVNVRDWLHVEDHCEAIWTIIHEGQDGESYNVGGESAWRNIDVVHELCRIVASEYGRTENELREQIVFVPDRPGHDLRYAMDTTKIRRELGFAPKRSFSDGLVDTVRWYMSHREWVDSVRSGAYQDWIETNYGNR